MKLEFSRRILEKYSDIKFRENPSRGSRVVSDGHTFDEVKSSLLAVLPARLKAVLQKNSNYIPKQSVNTINRFVFCNEDGVYCEMETVFF